MKNFCFIMKLPCQIDNFYNLKKFSEDKDYASAEDYFKTNKCERLEAGTELRLINNDHPDVIIVKPVDRPIHLYISSVVSR